MVNVCSSLQCVFNLRRKALQSLEFRTGCDYAGFSFFTSFFFSLLVHAQRPLAAKCWMRMRGRVQKRARQRQTSRGYRRRRGLVLLQRRETWHGDERERGSEWHSLIGINGSSEVWTPNAMMGSHDWRQNGKRDGWFHLLLHVRVCYISLTRRDT